MLKTISPQLSFDNQFEAPDYLITNKKLSVKDVDEQTQKKIQIQEWTTVDELIDEQLCESFKINEGKYWKPLHKDWSKQLISKIEHKNINQMEAFSKFMPIKKIR